MTPYLPTPTKLDSWRVKLGTGRNHTSCYGMTMALKGSSNGETEPKKATYNEAGHNNKTPDLIGDNSRHVLLETVARVQGIQ
jgi:hypothetical protein